MRRIQILTMTGLLCTPAACEKGAATQSDADSATAAENESAASSNGDDAVDADASQSAPKWDRGTPAEITASGEARAQRIGDFQGAVPTQWVKETSSSDTALAQFELPGPGGDAKLVVSRIPGGSADGEAALEQWKMEFSPPEGKSLDEVARLEKFKAGDLDVTLLDVQGRYVAAVTPDSEQRYDEPDMRMLAALVQGAGEPVSFKVIGPQETLDVWATPFRTLLAGLVKG